MLFIVLTLPGAIMSGYFYPQLSKSELGGLLFTLCDDITFSYHSLNFFVLLFTNTKFNSELKELFSTILKIITLHNSSTISTAHLKISDRNKLWRIFKFWQYRFLVIFLEWKQSFSRKAFNLMRKAARIFFLMSGTNCMGSLWCCWSFGGFSI